MTTWVLTPNEADPITQLQTPIVGWHLTQATALDVLEGMAKLAALGYHHRLETIDITIIPPIYQLSINRGPEAGTINDTDWFVTNGHTAWAITEDDATNNFTITQQ